MLSVGVSAIVTVEFYAAMLNHPSVIACNKFSGDDADAFYALSQSEQSRLTDIEADRMTRQGGPDWVILGEDVVRNPDIICDDEIS